MTKDNPQLNATEMQTAWDAWQKAFDAGRLLPHHDDFQEWWTATALTTSWSTTRDLMQAAWNAGLQDRKQQNAENSFQAWWEEIIASQPVISSVSVLQ